MAKNPAEIPPQEGKKLWEDELLVQAMISEQERQWKEKGFPQEKDITERLRAIKKGGAGNYEQLQVEREMARTRAAIKEDYERFLQFSITDHAGREEAEGDWQEAWEYSGVPPLDSSVFEHPKFGERLRRKIERLKELEKELAIITLREADTHNKRRAERRKEWEEQRDKRVGEELAYDILKNTPEFKETLKEGKKESLRSQQERMLKTAVENLARHYEEARSDEKKLKNVLEAAGVLKSKLEIGDFRDVRDTDDGYEARRLYREIADTVQNLQKAAKIRSSPTLPMPKEGEPAPSQEPQLEEGSQTPREEKIAAFRARKEELDKKVEELERKGGKKFDEAYRSAGAEAYDRGTAEHYNFDTKKIDEAIEEAKKVGDLRFRKLSIERLEAAKALIEKEIGVGETPPGPEPVPAPEPSPSPEPAPSVVKEVEQEEQGPDFVVTNPFESVLKEEQEEVRKKTEQEYPPAGPFPEDTAKETSQGASAGQAHAEAPKTPVSGAGITPETQQAFEELLGKKSAGQEESKPSGEESPASPELQRGEPEMKAEIDNVLLGEVLGETAKNPEVRKAAARLIEARKAMPEVWAYQKEKRLFEAAGAGGIDPARAVRMEGAEKAYEDALAHVNSLVGGERETLLRNQGKSGEEIAQELLTTKWDLYAAEDYRLAALRHEALPFEMKSLAAVNARFNKPFEWMCESRIGKFFHLKKEHAKYLRVGFGAAVATGIGLGTGAVAGAGLAAMYMGTRMGVATALMTGGGVMRAGAEKLFTAQAEKNIGNLLQKNRVEFNRLAKEQSTAQKVEANFQKMREQYREGVLRELRKKGIKGTAVTMGIAISSFLAARAAYAGVGDVMGTEPIPGGKGGVPETSPVRPHVELQEDSFRAQVDAAWERFTHGVKELGESAGEKFGDIMERANELKESGFSYGEAMAEALQERARELGIPFWWDAEAEIPKGPGGAPPPAEVAPPSTLVTPKLGPSIYPETESPPSTLVEPKLGPSIYPEETPKGETTPPVDFESRKSFGSPEEEAAALRRARGGLPPHESAEEVTRRLTMKDAGLARPGEPGTGMVGPSKEDIAKLDAAAKAVAEETEKITAATAETAGGKEAIITIEKGSNIWETSRKFIGHGMTEEEWRQAYLNSFVEIDGKKVPLNEVGFVKTGMQIANVDSAEGKQFLLRDFGNEAGTNDKLWDALVKEGKIKAGEPAPSQYQWLEKARGIEHHAPSPGEQAAHAAALAEARPAMTKATFEEITRERAAGTATLKEFVGSHDAFMKEFESDSLSDQEAKIADIERGFDHLQRANQLEGISRSKLRADFLDYEKKYATLLDELKGNSAYLENREAWGTFKHAWEVDGGFRGGKGHLFDKMMDRWSVGKYLDTVRKMQKGLFEPRVGDSLEQHLEIHRNGFLGLSQEVMKKISETKPSLNTNLGRFLKNTL